MAVFGKMAVEYTHATNARIKMEKEIKICIISDEKFEFIKAPNRVLDIHNKIQ